MDNRTPEEIAEAFGALPPQEQRKRLLLIPDYGSAYQDVVRPNQATLLPNYFYEKWVRLIGPLAATVYTLLRRRCYYDFSRKETDRDIAFPSQETLCTEAGMRSRKAIRAALVTLESYGLISRKPTFRNTPGSGHIRRHVDHITVFYDIPLVPDDLGPFLVAEGQRAFRKSTDSYPIGQSSSHRMEQKDPIGAAAVGRQPRMDPKDPHGAGSISPRKNYLEDLEANVNVGNGPLRDTLQRLKNGLLEARAGNNAVSAHHRTDRPAGGLLRLQALDGARRSEAEYALAAIRRFATDFDRSRRFYENAAANLSCETIAAVVNDLESLERSDNFQGWKNNRNAALVSDLLRVADEAGINLRRKRQ